MYCTNCGTQLVDQANFCSKCGKAAYGKTVEVGVTAEPIRPIYSTSEQVLEHTQKPARSFSGKARAAGIIQIVTASLWGLITIAQIINILNYGMGSSNLFVAVWNTVMTVYGIIDGVKLLNAGKGESRSALKGTVVGIAWYLIQAIVWHPFVIVFMFLEIATFILLLTEVNSND